MYSRSSDWEYMCSNRAKSDPTSECPLPATEWQLVQPYFGKSSLPRAIAIDLAATLPCTSALAAQLAGA